MYGDITRKFLEHVFGNSVQAADSFGRNGENGLSFLFSWVRCGGDSIWNPYLKPTLRHNSIAPARDLHEIDSVFEYAFAFGPS